MIDILGFSFMLSVHKTETFFKFKQFDSDLKSPDILSVSLPTVNLMYSASFEAR